MQFGFQTLGLVLATLVMLSSSNVNATAEQHVVLELFTSQGCSSCPPADALLKQLSAEDASLLPLSFHVHYWDYLGWKDPFSSTANTERQRTYARSVGQGQVYTPQLVVNGEISTIGSNEQSVREAIARVRQSPLVLNVALKPDQSGLTVIITPNSQVPIGESDIWGVCFNRYSKTSVSTGENGGRTLENINNVTSIQHLSTWHSGDMPLHISAIPNDDFAVFVQMVGQGKILGSSVYRKVSTGL